MSKVAELEVKEQQPSPEVNITPFGVFILTHLTLNPTSVKSLIPPWKPNRYRAIINYPMKYKPQPDTSRLEQLRGSLEAFHYFCEVEV